MFVFIQELVLQHQHALPIFTEAKQQLCLMRHHRVVSDHISTEAAATYSAWAGRCSSCSRLERASGLLLPPSAGLLPMSPWSDKNKTFRRLNVEGWSAESLSNLTDGQMVTWHWGTGSVRTSHNGERMRWRRQGCLHPVLEGHDPARFSVIPGRNRVHRGLMDPATSVSVWAERNPGAARRTGSGQGREGGSRLTANKQLLLFMWWRRSGVVASQ